MDRTQKGRHPRRALAVLACITMIANLPVKLDARAQSAEETIASALEWRSIGPFRAGRTVGAAGIPDRPNVFYIGVNNGGVWKTDDYGRTWDPIFDDQPTGSIGDLAVSPSHPETIYVGTGEGLHRPDLAVGNGMYRSLDGGMNWEHIGLSDAQQIASVVVHPTDPAVVYVAALGHPYGPNEVRGVYRSRNGGSTWDRVLFLDENTGAASVTMDVSDPDVLYADMWAHQEGPWENASWSGENSGLYKSTNGGETWKRLTGGLPGAAEGLGRIGIGIAPNTPERIYATVNASVNGGIYRSDDAGESWRIVSTQRRLWGRGNDFAEIKVHPTNPDVVFVGNIASYRSDDGGTTWTSIKGAPGGDDYHRIWINPKHPDVMLFATDQGATITVNGGRTWSSWYNQPTSQLYHVSTDNQFPYNVYGGQQESGAIKIASRGNGGQVSFRDWIGVGADEYAYVAPDPLDPNIVYGGRVVRHDLRSGQTQNVAPEALRSGKYRVKRTMPLLFHPADPTMLLYGTNVLFKTTTGGNSWEIISPDLSREKPDIPPSFDVYEGEPQRLGVIYALGPSHLDAAVIWAGTDDGLVHRTTDGGETWQNVTPPQVRSWDKIAQIDAGHHDVNTAYIAVNAIRSDDMTPHVYRTHDGGETWTEVVNGMSAFGPVNVVREDPYLPGLLFAGSEQEVYFSADDGDNWYSLRNNMPASSIRDLVVHEQDLVVGTHGRGIWILDNIAPLREVDKASAGLSSFLFQPVTATRVRWNMFSDTPMPPEEPTGENPPDGVAIDYLLSSRVDSVSITILDMAGEVVRRFASSDSPPAVDSTALPHPTYWIRPFAVPGIGAGMHRFIWDLRYGPPRGASPSFSIAAVLGKTPAGPLGPFVPGGEYIVRLNTPDGESERRFRVRLDPRVSTTSDAVAQQDSLSLRVYNMYHRAQTASESLDELSLATVRILGGKLSRRTRRSMEFARASIDTIRGAGAPGDQDIVYGSIYVAPVGQETVVGLQEKLLYILNVLQGADSRPTTQVYSAIDQLAASLDSALARTSELERSIIPRLNRELRKLGDDELTRVWLER